MLQASHQSHRGGAPPSGGAVQGHPATWLGAAAAREVLAGLDRDLAGVTFADGSGLSRDGRLRADLLTDLLLEAWRGDRHPELREMYLGRPALGGHHGHHVRDQRAVWSATSGPCPRLRRGQAPAPWPGTVALAGVTSLLGQRDRVFAVLANDVPGEARICPPDVTSNCSRASPRRASDASRERIGLAPLQRCCAIPPGVRSST